MISLSNGKIKRQYKTGKTNFQQELKPRLSEAINYFKNGQVTKFSVMTWTMYNLVCIDQDRKEIDKMAKKKIEKENTNINSMGKFRKYVNADPYSSQSYKFRKKQHRKYWYSIYNIMREALISRYAGNKTTLHEEDMQEGLDEGPDEMPDDLEISEINFDELGLD